MHPNIDASIPNARPFTQGNMSARTHDRGQDASSGRMLPEDFEVLRSIDASVYVVYSYGTPIAWYVNGRGWWMPTATYSVTTQKHKTYVRRAAGLPDDFGKESRTRPGRVHRSASN